MCAEDVQSDKRKHETLRAKAEIIKKLDEGKKLINLAHQVQQLLT
jgi:hypothetical protein